MTLWVIIYKGYNKEKFTLDMSPLWSTRKAARMELDRAKSKAQQREYRIAKFVEVKRNA